MTTGIPRCWAWSEGRIGADTATHKIDHLAGSPTGDAALRETAVGVSQLSRLRAVLTWAEVEAEG